MHRTRELTAALILALALGACETIDTLGPSGDAAQETAAATADDGLTALFSEAVAGYDAAMDSATAEQAERRRRQSPGGSLFDRLAAEIQGFGGLYRTSRCAIAVVLTDDADKNHALRVVHAALEPLVGRACPDGIRVEAVRGQFSYVGLHRYLHAVRPLLGTARVFGAHIDYAKNKVVLEVAGRDVAQWVLEALPRTGVPAEAVAFESYRPGIRAR